MTKLALGVLLAGLVACGGGDKPVLIDAPTDGFVTACNPVAQTGCAANEKCTWIIDQVTPNEVGHIGCAPITGNEVGVGEACLDASDPGGPPPGASGFDNCEKGAICIARGCQTICDPAQLGTASGCSEQFACGTYSGLFSLSGMEVAGACDPLCDLLTQRRLSDDAEQCGSRDPETGELSPDHPNRGCYPNAFFKSGSCAPVRRDDSPSNVAGEPLHNDRVGGVAPLTNGNGQAFKNGCAPGFTALYFESDTVNVQVCTGICAPLPVNSGLAGNLLGDATVPAKLPRSPAPVAGDATCGPTKKGDINQTACVFIYGLFAEDGVVDPELGPEGEQFGFCFPFQKFTYQDAGGNSIPYPNPTTLPARSGATPGVFPTIDDTADLLLEPRFRATTATRVEAGVPLAGQKRKAGPPRKSSFSLGENRPALRR